VRRSGERVRITAQLIDASTNSHIWSQTYDRSLDDLFAVQDEIAAAVATALQVTLAGKSPGERTPAGLAAYEHYLQGQFFHNRRAPGDVERSIAQFKEAVARDAGYARAWAALSGAYSLQVADMDVVAAAPLRTLQGEAARKAVELDPKLAIAQARYAQYLYQIQRFDAGDEHLRIAATLDPDDSLVLSFSASDAMWRGEFAEAVRLSRRVVALDPLSPISRANLGHALHLTGELEEALAEKKRALELSPDMGPDLEAEIARLLIALGRYDEAERRIASLPEGSFRDYAMALLHRAPGKQKEADAALARLAAAKRDIPDTIRLAEVYADRGEKDRAFDVLAERYRQLEQERAIRPRALWYFQDEMRISPYLQKLRTDPRWTQVAVLPA
jgi:tetratricopeptide (TPR) repeat protein